MKANPSKSLFFYSGILDRVELLLLGELRMNEGHLPVRYLGVLLISTRIFVVDCVALLTELLAELIPGCLGISLMQEGSSCCLYFYIVCRFIRLVFLFFLRRSSRLLNRNLIDFYGLERMKVLLRRKFLGVLRAFRKRKEV